MLKNWETTIHGQRAFGYILVNGNKKIIVIVIVKIISFVI